MLQTHHRIEQPKLFPVRKTIIQIVESPILQPPKLTGQSMKPLSKQTPMTRPGIQEKPERSFHTKIIYQIPRTIPQKSKIAYPIAQPDLPHVDPLYRVPSKSIVSLDPLVKPIAHQSS